MSYISNADWSKCTECGQCLMQCPVLKMEKIDAVKAIHVLINGDISSKLLDQCTFCFNCNQYCPIDGLRPHELILQRALEKRKKVPKILKYLCNGRQTRNMFIDLFKAMSTNEKQILKKWSIVPNGGDIMWIGCIGKLSCLDIDRSEVMAPLTKYGPMDLCCGELAYRLGSWEMYEETITRTLAVLKTLKINRMVCYCGSCYNYFTTILPDVYGKKLPYPVISLYEWLWEQYEQGHIQVKNPRTFKAAIHESCYVSELGNDFSNCLHRLYKVMGVDTVELAHHGDRNLSCGAVSIVRNMNLISSMFKEQIRKYKEVSEAGASEIALNCPGCFVTLSFTNWMFGKKLRYMPEELLSAFGDEITLPLAQRIPDIAKSVILNLPRIIFY